MSNSNLIYLNAYVFAKRHDKAADFHDNHGDELLSLAINFFPFYSTNALEAEDPHQHFFLQIVNPSFCFPSFPVYDIILWKTGYESISICSYTTHMLLKQYSGRIIARRNEDMCFKRIKRLRESLAM
ncbi:hypothetical protein PNOK_0524400 [Pyrrhoderma noxium]|uniref:Uncharacterized protein n=1 Tax=Pyrrhoderma noxium TaxID=2282107 RepID=A0A286UFK6_9AGAM|nr:hypothetical protein PNOK_0524400 [Pyrrhoderma noxium]